MVYQLNLNGGTNRRSKFNSRILLYLSIFIHLDKLHLCPARN